MKNFFQRQKSEGYKHHFLPKISRQLNINNLDGINKQKVLSLYKPEIASDFLAYRFDLLKKWMDNNNNYSKEYVVALDEVIDKLYLSKELNSFEQQYIKNVQAIVFAKNRNLKQLIVDFSINKGEFVFYRYEIDSFKLIHGKDLVQIIDDAELYITTQRIIIAKQIDIISLYYKDIKAYDYKDNKLLLELNNKRKCYIEGDNNEAIVQSLERVLKREKIELKKYE